MALSLAPGHLALASSIILALWGCGARPSSVPDTRAPALDRAHAVMDDGYPLPFDAWQPAGKARAVVLALHGFNEYRKAFADVGPFLARQGIALPMPMISADSGTAPIACFGPGPGAWSPM